MGPTTHLGVTKASGAPPRARHLLAQDKNKHGHEHPSKQLGPSPLNIARQRRPRHKSPGKAKIIVDVPKRASFTQAAKGDVRRRTRVCVAGNWWIWVDGSGSWSEYLLATFSRSPSLFRLLKRGTPYFVGVNQAPECSSPATLERVFHGVKRSVMIGTYHG